MKRQQFLITALFVLVLLGISPVVIRAQTGRYLWAAGAYLFHDEVKVVVGSPRTEGDMVRYTAQRLALLRQLARQEPDREMEAVLVFSTFLSPDKTASLVARHHLRAEEIYLAVPYMPGGGGATVFSSIQDAYDTYVLGMKRQVEQLNVEELEAHGIDPSGFLERAQAVIEGRARIYAVRVKGRLADLAASIEDPVCLVDVFYHPDVEAAARALRKGPVHYVVSPRRPDGLP